MKLYKFLHKQHAASILGGTFLFKDYRTFRDLPPPIGDPKEGLASLEVGKPYPFNDADGPGALGPIFKFEGEWSAKAYPIQIEGLTIQYELPDLFISCFSVGDPSALEREMLHKKPERYDAAVEIVDEGLLREFLWREGVVRELGLPLRSVAKVIGNPVQYIETPRSPRSHRIFCRARRGENYPPTGIKGSIGSPPLRTSRAHFRRRFS